MISQADHFDAIVLGQGLAGTALAWSLRWIGLKVLVVDREADVTSSKIAAGLITPITGQKLIRSWRHSELWPAAVSFYQKIERETGSRFLRQPSVVRLFKDAAEPATFERRRSAGEYVGILREPYSPTNGTWFDSPHGGFEMSPGGQLDVGTYLTTSRFQFVRDGSYVAADVDVSRDIELVPGGVRLLKLNVTAETIVFCQGFEPRDNPWFRDVRLKPARGEIVTLKIPGLTEERVVHRGVWLAPLGGDLFRAGSTYDWKHLDTVPTTEGLNEILDQVRSFLKLPFQVISHTAAVRPIHRNQYPVIGLHPEHPQLGYFNGLGSKGSLQAPYFAQQLAACIGRTGPIDPDVDLNRRTRWRSAGTDSMEVDKGNLSAARHVKPGGRRPLTQQAQDAVRLAVGPGDTVIDATAGNGHDTQFLSELVGETGAVFAFDIQPAAIEKTARRLADARLANVTLLNCSHGEIKNRIPPERHSQIAAVMFNLGYLPGGDKAITTEPESTRSAIAQAAEVLKTDGLMTILAYTGHDGGSGEAAVVDSILENLPSHDFEVSIVESEPGRVAGPRMFLVKRKT